MEAHERALAIAGLRAVGLLKPDVAPSEEQLAELLAAFQAIHGLKVDGELGPVTQRALDRPRFCAVPDRVVLDASQKCRWDHAKLWDGTKWTGTPARCVLRWNVTAPLTGFSQAQTDQAFVEALSYWEAVCAVKFVRDPSAPNLLFNIGPIDDASGTLAWQELPCGRDSVNTKLEGLYDSGEPWVISATPPPNKIDAVRVVCHEVGHGIGLDHGPEGALLAPYYDKSIRQPQKWDIAEAQFRYGPPPVEEPTTPTTPTPEKMHITAMAGGVKYMGEIPVAS